MLNYKTCSAVIAQLLLFESLLLLMSLATSLIYREQNLEAFAIPLGVSLLLSLVLRRLSKGHSGTMTHYDGFLTVVATWVVFSIIGTIPFLIDGCTERLSCAFFESMSGFTTTGASTFTDIDSLPRSINFWRCLTHWIGGVGIVFFTIAILPGTSSGNLRLFSAESIGPKLSKLHPRIKTTVRWIGGLYLALTLACAVSYHLAGMSVFDAVCHAFSTLGTGGFSTHQDSMAWFHSPAVEYVCIVFMLLAATNFSLLYLAVVKGGFREALKDEEVRWFYTTVFLMTIAAAILLHSRGVPMGDSLRRALFHVASVSATAGFTLEDFTLWHPAVWFFAIFLVCQGGISGSTAGGLKVVRIISIWRSLKNEFRKILHPHAVFTCRINNTPIHHDIMHRMLILALCYFLLAFIATGIFHISGVPVIDGFSCACSALSGVGPGFGTMVSPVESWSKLPDIALWGYSFLMLAGRLEIFAVLILFFPAFWKKA